MKHATMRSYILCGAVAQQRIAFFSAFCSDQKPMMVRFTHQSACAEPTDEVCLIPEGLSPRESGERIAQALTRAQSDALWIDWEDDEPLDEIFKLFQTQDLSRLCRLWRVVRCGEAEAELAMLSHPDANLRAQVAQCNLIAIAGASRKQLTTLRRRAAALQPDLEVIAQENQREVMAVLNHASLLQPLRLMLILAFVGAALLLLNRLKYPVKDTLSLFLGTYLQALPFLLLGILLSSAIQVFVPAGFLQRVFPKNRMGGMLFGVLGGFFLPVCDCASIPVFRSLLRKGVPLPAAIAFMTAAPVINPVVMLSTYYAFGGNARMMLLRMAFGVVCSFLIGLSFSFYRAPVLTDPIEAEDICCAGDHPLPGTAPAYPRCACHDARTIPDAVSGDADCACHEVRNSRDPDSPDEICTCHNHPKGPMSQGVRGHLVTLIAHFEAEFMEVGKYLLIGIGVSAVIQLLMGNQVSGVTVGNLAEGLLFMMGMAFLLSLCSSSDAVVGKNMGSALPLGAVMGFLVFGPMMDIKNLILLSSSFTKRFIVQFLLVTFAVCFGVVYLAFSLGVEALVA